MSTSPDWVVRAQEELDQLVGRIDRLTAFLTGQHRNLTVPNGQIELMQIQLHHMVHYQTSLECRIKLHEMATNPAHTDQASST